MFTKEEVMRKIKSMPPEQFKQMIWKVLDESGIEYTKDEAGLSESFGKLELSTLEDLCQEQEV